MICEIIEKSMQNKIEIYHDGPTEDQIKTFDLKT